MSDSQTEGVLALLRDRGKAGITALDALDIVGSLRLSARIYDLKAQGYEISMTTETTPSGKHIGRYRLLASMGPTAVSRALATADTATPACPICGTTLSVVTVSAFDPGFGAGRCRNCRKDVTVKIDGPRA